jgi:uncharacterized protein
MRTISPWLSAVVLLACAGCQQAKPTAQPEQAKVQPEVSSSLRTRSPPSPSDATGQKSAESVVQNGNRGLASSQIGAKANHQSMQSLDELLLFFPSKYPEGEWEPKGLDYSDVWFKAADNTRLHGWYCPSDNPRATLLFAHGNGGNLTHRADLLRRFQTQLRVSTLIFDYRGYGRSEGVPTVEGILDDTRAAREFLADRARINQSDIVLMGESLGGAVVVQLAVEKRARGLILDRTFSSLKDVAAHHYKAMAWLVPSKKLNSAAEVSRYSGPLFQSHGDTDSIVPFALGRKLFDAANEPKQFVQLPNTDHNDKLPDEYYRQLDAFIGRL